MHQFLAFSRNRLISPMRSLTLVLLAVLQVNMAAPVGLSAQPAVPTAGPQLVWIDTDIADDLDDAFALGLILHSPELKVLGISTAFGDTELRARFVDRFLAATSNSGIPVTAGIPTKTGNVMTQAAYARQFPASHHPDGIAAMLNAINEHPGQVSLIAIGPLFNIGAAIDRDPTTFRKLQRVVMMGGSIDRGYDGKDGERRPADAEWNIKCDPQGAGKLFATGVEIFMMPLDSTQVHLLAPARDDLFAHGSPMTDQLTLAYHQWMAHSWDHAANPTLFDPVAAAFAFQPKLCPTRPIRIEVDSQGFTRKIDGKPNAQVCLKSDEAAFLKLLMTRLEQEGH